MRGCNSLATYDGAGLIREARLSSGYWESEGIRAGEAARISGPVPLSRNADGNIQEPGQAHDTERLGTRNLPMGGR